MATQWRYCLFDQEFGPVSYAELVQLVRDETLSEGDLVQMLPFGEWQRADRVPGLYHMARRASAMPASPTDELSAEPGDAATLDEMSAGEGEEAISADSNGPSPRAQAAQPEWLRKLLYFRDVAGGNHLRGKQEANRQGRHTAGTEVPHEGQDQDLSGQFAASEDEDVAEFGSSSPQESSSRAGSPSAWSDTVEAALASVDAHRTERRPLGRVARLFTAISAIAGAVASKSALRLGFRWGTTVVMANLTAVWIDKWAAREALRFPSRDYGQVPHYFPIVGECSSTTYAFLLLDMMLAAGAAAYLAARWLESRADDP